MPIEKVPGGMIIRGATPHRCAPPDPRAYNIGDRFACDCGKHFELIDAQTYQGGPFWQTVPPQAGDGGR